jgi:hypothetical protein
VCSIVTAADPRCELGRVRLAAEGRSWCRTGAAHTAMRSPLLLPHSCAQLGVGGHVRQASQLVAAVLTLPQPGVSVPRCMYEYTAANRGSALSAGSPCVACLRRRRWARSSACTGRAPRIPSITSASAAQTIAKAETAGGAMAHQNSSTQSTCISRAHQLKVSRGWLHYSYLTSHHSHLAMRHRVSLAMSQTHADCRAFPNKPDGS